MKQDKELSKGPNGALEMRGWGQGEERTPHWL